MKGLDKDFDLRVLGYDDLYFPAPVLPLLYPSRAFIYHKSKLLEVDENSYTGQVFHVEKGLYGDAVWGPYIRLDSGKYQVEVAYRYFGVPQNSNDFGSLEVKIDKGVRRLSSIPFVFNSLQRDKFQIGKTDFHLDIASPDVEFVIFSNGQLDFYIDYIRLTKI